MVEEEIKKNKNIELKKAIIEEYDQHMGIVDLPKQQERITYTICNILK